MYDVSVSIILLKSVQWNALGVPTIYTKKKSVSRGFLFLGFDISSNEVEISLLYSDDWFNGPRILLINCQKVKS